MPILLLRKRKLRHSLGRPSRSDFVQLHFMVTNSYEDSENIERFFDLGYSSKGQNRGIGLSKLKHMVNKYNGEIVIAREDEKISLLKIGIIIAI